MSRKCAYCGEGTKCGWYGQGDGTYLCDDCGDMVYDLDHSSIGDLSMNDIPLDLSQSLPSSSFWFRGFSISRLGRKSILFLSSLFRMDQRRKCDE